MDSLPAELILHIVQFLEPREVALLRSVSKKLYLLANDSELWRNICFNNTFAESSRSSYSGLAFRPNLPFQGHPQVQEFRRRTELALSAQQAWVGAAAGTESGTPDTLDQPEGPNAAESSSLADVEYRERARRLANWDPSYQSEKVNWYGEYIARHGPLKCSWLQPPLIGNDGSVVEARGMALLDDDKLIAPLEDDSFAVWTTRSGDLQGRCIHKSKPGILQTEGRSINPTISSTISVDSERHKAYIVVQDYLQELDIETGQVSTSQHFPAKIAALSDFDPTLPFTVGTRSAVHLYDPREQLRHGDEATNEHLDPMSTYPEIPTNGDSFSLLAFGNADRFAALHQNGPTAIQHLSGNGVSSVSNDIVISGRFPSLLVYDRRTFPKVKATLYSGAQLCGLAALPYAYSALDSEIMRKGELPINATQQAKSRSGHTLLACGEYKGKGSLEIYGLSDEDGAHLQTSTFKNRFSAARAKILSIANHGAKIVISDAEGGIRWLERDGQTMIRRWNINRFDWPPRGNANTLSAGPSNDEAVLKLLPTRAGSDNIYDDGVFVWTGERIGLLNFSSQPRFGGENGASWEEIVGDAEDAIKRREEKIYGETMKRALEQQANEVRWMSGLGLSG